jgi:hypothetical protein
MNPDLTEDEMRRGLFGDTEPSPRVAEPRKQKSVPEVVLVKAAPPVAKKKAAKAFTPRLQVTLRVGNEFEGKTFELTHESDTLSKLLAEQEAVKIARNKFRYIEVVSVKSM